MATQIVTVPSDTQGPWTTDTLDHRVDITIPNDGSVYDMNKSAVRFYLNQTVTPPTTNPAPYGVGAQYSFRVAARNDNDIPLPNTSLVRHVEVSTDRHNVIDNRRYNDFLMNTLSAFVDDDAQRNDGQAFGSIKSQAKFLETSVATAADRGFVYRDAFLDYQVLADATAATGDPSKMAKQREVVASVPLNRLSEAFMAESWPMALTGETRLRLELPPLTDFQCLRKPLLPVPIECADVAPAAQVTQVLTTPAYRDPEMIPFYPGMPITVNYTDDGGVDRTDKRHVTAVEWRDDDDYRVVVTFNAQTAHNVDTGVTISAVEGPGADHPTKTLSIRAIELQLVRKTSGSIPDALTFRGLKMYSFAYTAAANTTHTLQAKVPSARTATLLMMWPSTANAIPFSNGPDVDGPYRIVINDEFLHPQTKFGTSDHRHWLIQALKNGGYTVRSLVEQMDDNNGRTVTVDNDLRVIAAPLPILPRGQPDHVVQLEMTHAAAGQYVCRMYGQEFVTVKLRDVGQNISAGVMN